VPKHVLRLTSSYFLFWLVILNIISMECDQIQFEKEAVDSFIHKSSKIMIDIDIE